MATSGRDSHSRLAERLEVMNDDKSALEEFGKRWAEAELARDLTVLDALAHRDFMLVGPLGFVIDKTQWLDRYRSGDLVTSSLDWRDTAARVFGDCAVVLGFMIRRLHTAAGPTTVGSARRTFWCARRVLGTSLA